MTSIGGECFMISVGLQPLLATREGERKNKRGRQRGRRRESHSWVGRLDWEFRKSKDDWRGLLTPRAGGEREGKRE